MDTFLFPLTYDVRSSSLWARFSSTLPVSVEQTIPLISAIRKKAKTFYRTVQYTLLSAKKGGEGVRASTDLLGLSHPVPFLFHRAWRPVQ